MSTGQGDSQADRRAACMALPCLWADRANGQSQGGREGSAVCHHSHGCAARVSPLGEQRKSWRPRVVNLRMCARRYLLHVTLSLRGEDFRKEREFNCMALQHEMK